MFRDEEGYTAQDVSSANYSLSVYDAMAAAPGKVLRPILITLAFTVLGIRWLLKS